MMQKILITGSDGMLGKAFVNQNPEFIGMNKKEFDITNKNQMMEVIEKFNIKTIINCAAYTNVEEAEDYPEKAFLINTIGIYNLCIIAKKYGILLINFSTDYVFSGEGIKKIDTHNYPINTYGSSKLCGEQIMKCFNVDGTTIRTSWLYGPYGDNFVTKIVNLLKNNDKINVIDDQVGAPTYTLDLVDYTLDLLKKDKLNNFYHYSNIGEISWFDFARRIKNICELECEINPCDSNFIDQKAARPKYSKLEINSDNSNLFRDWVEALKEYIINHVNIEIL